MLDEMPGGELGHLARSDEKDRLSFERTKDFSGEVDGYRGNGDAA